MHSGTIFIVRQSGSFMRIAMTLFRAVLLLGIAFSGLVLLSTHNYHRSADSLTITADKMTTGSIPDWRVKY